MQTENINSEPQESSTEDAKSPETDNAKSLETDNAHAKKPLHPATQMQKIMLSLFLVSLTFISLFKIYDTIGLINKDTLAEVSIPWVLPDGVILKDAPAGFYYESKGGRLIHSGPITAERKLVLRDLLEADSTKTSSAVTPKGGVALSSSTDKSNAHKNYYEADVASSKKKPMVNLEKVQKSYNHAIDKLAYLSSVRQSEVIQLMLVLGLLGGALGALLRSLVDFVGHACYTDQLDLVLWWPLYLTRPIVGAILGFILIVLFKAKLLVIGEAQSGDDSFWWLGVAVLGGFSTVDVTLRLRLAAKALFGAGSAGN